MTVNAVDTPQTQKQREDEFFAISLDENDVIKQDRIIPRSKLKRNMNEFAEQLFWKEIRGFYIGRG